MQGRITLWYANKLRYRIKDREMFLKQMKGKLSKEDIKIEKAIIKELKQHLKDYEREEKRIDKDFEMSKKFREKYGIEKGDKKFFEWQLKNKHRTDWLRPFGKPPKA